MAVSRVIDNYVYILAKKWNKSHIQTRGKSRLKAETGILVYFGKLVTAKPL